MKAMFQPVWSTYCHRYFQKNLVIVIIKEA